MFKVRQGQKSIWFIFNAGEKIPPGGARVFLGLTRAC